MDSEILAQLSRMDFIPRYFKPDRATRSLRKMVRHKAFLVRERTRVKNSVHAPLSSLNIKSPFGDLFSRSGREFLSSLRLPEEKKLAPGGKASDNRCPLEGDSVDGRHPQGEVAGL